jgi:hypothetical protein
MYTEIINILPFISTERGAKIFGVFRLKNHDFVPKKIIFFPILGGARTPPLLDLPLYSGHLGEFDKMTTIDR